MASVRQDGNPKFIQVPNYNSVEFNAKEIKFTYYNRHEFDEDGDGVNDAYSETTNYVVYKGEFQQRNGVISGTFIEAYGERYTYHSSESGALPDEYRLEVDGGFTVADFARFQTSGEAGWRALFDGDDDLYEGVLYGYGGDDTFHGHSGDGGDGFDTVTYEAATGSVFVDLLQDKSYISIELIIASRFADTMKGSILSDNLDGGAGNDMLDGRSGDDTLQGGAGNDTLAGSSGNDILIGGAGADRLEGGGGIDWASYSTARTRVAVDLSRPGENRGDADGDSFRSIEGIIGSRYADKLYGNDNANSLSGGSGSDSLDGRGGNDILRGNSGNDTLSGGAGSDRLIGGTGADRLEGGSGADRFIYTAVSDSTIKAPGRDFIADFNRQAGDKVDLSGLDADTRTPGDQAFLTLGFGGYVGTGAALRYSISDNIPRLYGDVNGDGKDDFCIQIKGVDELMIEDFIL